MFMISYNYYVFGKSCTWEKIGKPGVSLSFHQLYDSYIQGEDKNKMLLVAYRYGKDTNHCINIDTSTNTILDTDNNHPLPFSFVTYEEYMSTLALHFNIANIESYLVISVYELKRALRSHTM